MRHILLVVALLMALAPVAAPRAQAQENCTEGKTASGKCINPHLARLMRHQSIRMTQPKLSYTAPLAMPGDKDAVEPPRQLIELLSIQASGGRSYR